MEKMTTALCLMLITLAGMAQTNAPTGTAEVDEFNRIIVSGGGNLLIHYSGKHELEVRSGNGSDGVADISVVSKTLYIKITGSGINPHDVAINVGVPALMELVQHGGGNVVFREGFSPQNSFVCEVHGGGNVDVSALPVNFFDASIEGGGVIVLRAERELDGNISGGGLIKYSGDPKVTSAISGGGAIRKKL